MYIKLTIDMALLLLPTLKQCSSINCRSTVHGKFWQGSDFKKLKLYCRESHQKYESSVESESVKN